GYTKLLADTVIAVREAGADATVQSELLGEVSMQLTAARKALKELERATAEASAMKNVKAQAFFYKDTVKEAMEALRIPVDALEMLVDKRAWPVPSYGELIFEV
ncbi:MAG: glutamine synthetase type III, partial [Acetatifactor sp.]|nr:glutamine synthetase type III [Acetatifactor sp.]